MVCNEPVEYWNFDANSEKSSRQSSDANYANTQNRLTNININKYYTLAQHYVSSSSIFVGAGDAAP